MGCEGRILLFTDADSPPAWGVLNVMNFGERELSFIKWLNWMEADESYSRRESTNVCGADFSLTTRGGRHALHLREQDGSPYATAQCAGGRTECYTS